MKTDLHPVHQTHDGFFNTHSGLKVSIHNPTLDMICIEDISHGLSNVCRFGGHTDEFYSVAQHSCLVFFLAPMHLGKHALLHDATEAYLGDVIKPLKRILGMAYTEIESRFEKLIAEKFQIDQSLFIDVKPWDKKALEYEHNFFFKNEREPMLRLFGNQWPCWTPEIAKDLFLQHFKGL